ncbi:hypothetical protein J3Q64DRAFT_1609869, partial [Phycomyces blakesleeanus]
CTEFRNNQQQPQALAETDSNFSEARNRILTYNTQENNSSVAKCHLSEPVPATMSLQ